MSSSVLRIALGVALGIGIVIGVLALAFVLLRGGGLSAPDNLAAGDCIDIPAEASISSIPKRSCTAPHAGEVFLAFDAPGAGAYPSDPAWGEIIYPVCDPAFATYTGTPVEERTDIDYQYFVPTQDRWAAGERGVTCFIKSIDGSPLVRSYRVAR